MCVNLHAEKIALCATVLALLFTAVLFEGEVPGIRKANLEQGYETRLFNTSKIHEINIIMDEWDDFLDTCENELYSPCSVVIDGERLDNIGVRAKGNTSLANVRMMGSQRYSLKLEFDHYQTGKTYHGLDKLCLNNLIQDNTYMKDFLTFRMMDEFGAAASLCSYALIRINGEPWGLFLAIEGVEDSFLKRNYGGATGALYKPDPMRIGGDPGNGRDFRMKNRGSEFLNNNGFPPPPDMGGNAFPQPPPDMGGGPPGMGSPDVMLKYIDDKPDSYANIFGSAKTYVTPAAQARLIRALRTLNESLQDGKSYLAYQAVYDQDVMRYFVVHNYVVNGDSYTGGMIHNYYLYEDAGKLRMLPWDYNLAFGSFQGRNATTAVNDPIDAPLSVSGDGNRPMADWILKEPHINRYHVLCAEFLNNIDVQEIIDSAYRLIAPVAASDELDPTHFCDKEAFETGVETLREFCKLHSESWRGQLEDDASLIDASHIDLSAMGSMGGPGGPNAPGGFGGLPLSGN